MASSYHHECRHDAVVAAEKGTPGQTFPRISCLSRVEEVKEHHSKVHHFNDSIFSKLLTKMYCFVYWLVHRTFENFILTSITLEHPKNTINRFISVEKEGN